ncbi:hypothetical protein SAMN05192541_14372 [Bradyrhizobium arachidis]|nr:hypothetical protein SAMN05192541_14372 [Bradyrhizobium arachidis]
MNDDDLAVNDRLTFEVESTGDDGEFVDPVVAVSRVGATIISVDAKLDA